MEGIFGILSLSTILKKLGECCSSLEGFDTEDGVWELCCRERRCYL